MRQQIGSRHWATLWSGRRHWKHRPASLLLNASRAARAELREASRTTVLVFQESTICGAASFLHQCFFFASCQVGETATSWVALTPELSPNSQQQASLGRVAMAGRGAAAGSSVGSLQHPIVLRPAGATRIDFSLGGGTPLWGAAGAGPEGGGVPVEAAILPASAGSPDLGVEGATAEDGLDLGAEASLVLLGRRYGIGALDLGAEASLVLLGCRSGVGAPSSSSMAARSASMSSASSVSPQSRSSSSSSSVSSVVGSRGVGPG